jgi:Fic family protein
VELRKVTEQGDWTGWVLYMLDMVEQTALKARKQIADIAQLMTNMGAEIQRALPKIYSKDLMETLFRLPYTKRSNLAEAGLGSIKTVGTYLQALEKSGFLRSEAVGKEKLYLNYRLLDVLKA